MIIYGKRATLITNEIIMEKCSHCGAQNSLQLSVFQKYAHVYWIPCFPKGKTGVVQCMKCYNVTQQEEFTKNLSENYELLKSKSKTPLWTFVGIVLLAAFITYFSIRNNM